MKNNILFIYKVAFDSTLDAIICSDESNVVTLANPAAEKMFGYSQNDLLGQPVSLLMPVEFRERHNNGLKNYLKTGNSRLLGKTIEVVGLNKNGNTFPIELTITVNEDDNSIFTAILRDITDRKHREKLDLENAKIAESEKSILELKDSLIQAIRAIAHTTEKRDPYTSANMSRVSELAEALGRKLELLESSVEALKLGASIHDIGNIYIPADIQNRPGKLSNAEFEIIKEHPQVGYDIIKKIELPWPIADMILSHHERLDGSGYPNGLKGDEISLEAQIIAVADVLEAVISHRPYRPAKSIEEGLKILKDGKGVHYSPEVVDACIAVFKIDGFEFSTNY